MMNYSKIPVCLLIVVILLYAPAASAGSGNVMSEKNIPGQVESKARRLMHDLKKKGFEVSRGYFKLWTDEQCDYTFERMKSCFGNNPAAPYVMLVVPPWPEEFVDPISSTTFGPSLPGYIDVYRFDPREAIVILGQLPPQASYFSEMTYLFTRQGTFDEKSLERYQEIYESVGEFADVFFQKSPADPDRYMAFSSLSNPINNVVIQNQSHAAFNQIRYFIITPDKVMDKAVRQAFSDIKVRDEDVFTEQIPEDMNVGLDKAADDFITSIRYAHADDVTAADAWRAKLPLFVLRVRDTNHDAQAYPQFKFADLEGRSAEDEYRYEPDLEDLLEAVAEKWGQPCGEEGCADRAESFIDIQVAPVSMVGPLCNEINQNCLGDNWDPAYQLLPPKPLDSGEIYAVAGTLGTETGNATYVGLSINQSSRFKGVLNIANEKLKGSAAGYSEDVDNTDKLFLVYFTRDCTGLEEITDNHCVEIPTTKIPEGDNMVLGVRDYIMPDTQRGPDSALVLPSRALKLTAPQQQP